VQGIRLENQSSSAAHARNPPLQTINEFKCFKVVEYNKKKEKKNFLYEILIKKKNFFHFFYLINKLFKQFTVTLSKSNNVFF
jgi:hypothetical protein